MSKKLLILGAGGFAREVAWLVDQINRQTPTWDLLGFVESKSVEAGTKLNGRPVMSLEEACHHLPDAYIVAGIGSPRIKERAIAEVQDMGFSFATLIHPSVLMDETTVTVGAGSVICAGNILTVNITIGQHAMINLDCTVGHDSVIEDFVTVSPGCHLSGYTTLRRGAYIGTGAVTVEHHEIGEYATIGAGGVVTKDIAPGVTAVGMPARPKA